MDYTYRRLTSNDYESYVKLSNTVLNGLSRKEFFYAYENTLIKVLLNKTNAYFYGAFFKEQLIGVAHIYQDVEAIKIIKMILNINDSKIIKLGGALVLKEYRNQGIMKKIEKYLINVAKYNKYDYLYVTVHPDNIPSIKVLNSTSAIFIQQITLHDNLRNLYLIDLKSN